jgi:hypothetical protein
MLKEQKRVNLFLDSGAFSAWSKGLEIKIEEYIQFIKDNINYLDHYSVLDAIGDPVITLRNQGIMEAAGLSPIPCFHYGEPIKYLQSYLEKYSYISLGGMVPISTADLKVWLDMLFGKFICDKNTGLPTCKIHGFGMTSLNLMLRYPWYSVDSTSWVMTGRFGSVMVPKFRFGKYIYDENSWKVTVSNQSPSQQNDGQHFSTFSRMEQEIILQYFEEKGFKLGKSEYREEKRKTYKLQEGERWVNSADASAVRELVEQQGIYAPNPLLAMRDMVEIVVEPGLMNDYKQRDELNIIYFLDLEKSLPEWPWAWTKKSPAGFGFR